MGKQQELLLISEGKRGEGRQFPSESGRKSCEPGEGKMMWLLRSNTGMRDESAIRNQERRSLRSVSTLAEFTYRHEASTPVEEYRGQSLREVYVAP